MAITGAFVWTFISGDLARYLSDASALPMIISFLLAFFAIWLSVSFYYKASEASNSFYVRSFTFAKQTIELLIEIKAIFEEKLKDSVQLSSQK